MENTFETTFLEISSSVLKQNRSINVSIPKAFLNNELPVLFLLDGGKSEQLNFILKTVSEVLNEGSIQPFIIVGIENIERNYDFTSRTSVRKDRKWVPKFGNAHRFKQFIVSELIPFIEQNYPVSKDRSIIGESLGGLLIMDILYQYPNEFSNYIAIDPSLWWNDNELLKRFEKEWKFKESSNISLWISSSKTKAIWDVTHSFDQWITKEKLISNYWFDVDEEQTHFSIFKAHVKKALKWNFSSKL